MSGLPYLWSHLSFMLVATATYVGLGLIIGALLDRYSDGPRSESRLYRWRLLPAITLAVLGFSAQLGNVQRGPVDVSGHLLALTGELSFGSVLFLATLVAGRVFGGRWRIPAERWYAAQWGWLLAGLALYGTSLSGRGPDVYGWGYHPAMAGAMLALSAVAAVSGRWMLAVLGLGTVLVWQLGVSPSTNLWDLAVDPFIFVGSLSQIAFRGVTSRRRGRTNSGSPPRMQCATAVSAAA